MDELIADFLAEASDHLDTVEATILHARSGAAQADAHACLNTLKTQAEALSLQRAARICAAADALLGNGQEALPLLLRALMRLRDILSDLAETGAEPAGDDSDLISAAEKNRLPTLSDTLAFARERLLQIAPAERDPRLNELLSRISSLGAELHDTEHIRPIAECYENLGALVETAAKTQGKRLALYLEGEIKIGLNAVAPLREALAHLVRNACAHGVETPGERRAAGKPETGRIRINARRDAAAAIVEISDDGRGLDMRALRLRAIANGVSIFSQFDPDAAPIASIALLAKRGGGLEAARAAIAGLGGDVALTLNGRPGVSFTITLPDIANAAPPGDGQTRYIDLIAAPSRKEFVR